MATQGSAVNRAAAPGRVMTGTVLVVEDHWLLLTELASLLEDEGYRVLRAWHGEAALDILAHENADVVLCDWHMPQTSVDGLELLRRLKADERDPYFILMSARGDIEDRVAGLDCGANDYLVKPFDARELLARVAVGMRTVNASRKVGESIVHLERHLQEAWQAQMALLPTRPGRVGSVRYDYRFTACDFVSGDGLDVRLLPDGRTLVYLFDVSGHGVPAVMMATQLQKLLSSPRFFRSLETLSAVAIVEAVNQEFSWERTGRLITLFLAIVEPATGRMRYVSAGHPQPYLVRQKGPVTVLRSDGFLLGLDQGLVADTLHERGLSSGMWREFELVLEPGDCVVAYSDAVLEARNVDGQQMKPETIVSTLSRCRRPGLQCLLSAMETAVKRHRQEKLEDDFSLLAWQYVPEG